MKFIKYIFVFLLLFFTSCDRQLSLAKDNVLSYVSNSFASGEKINDAVFSKLYVIAISDESKLPEPSSESMVADLSLRYEALTLSVTLKAVGCTNDVFDNIVRADKYFRKYDVVASEYVMLGFFEVVDQLGERSAIPGCFLLDSEFKVISRHDVFDKRYVYINSIKK